MRRYPAVGGPLDGKMVSSKDFYQRRPATNWSAEQPAGRYAEYLGVYHSYNRADRFKKGPSMIFLHESLLP